MNIKHSHDIPTHHQRLSRQHVLGWLVVFVVLAAMVGAAMRGML